MWGAYDVWQFYELFRKREKNIRVSQHKSVQYRQWKQQQKMYNKSHYIKWILDSFFGQWPILPDFVLYNFSVCGGGSGVDGDEGVGVCYGDYKGLKFGVSITSKLVLSQSKWAFLRRSTDIISMRPFMSSLKCFLACDKILNGPR